MASQRRTPAKRTPASAHQAQTAVEGVVVTGKVTLLGAEFRMAERVGIAPMILLAVAGKKGVDSADAEGFVALHDLISDCIAQDEYDRFWRHAVDMKADADDLQQVVKDAMEVLAARPTGSPGGSSAGRRKTSANSKESSQRTATDMPEGMVSVDSLLGR